MTIKLVVFDFGRTLYDRDSTTFFPDTKDLLDYLRPKYKLAIVSIARADTPEERIAKLEETGLHDYFSSILFSDSEKDSLFMETLDKFHVKPEEIAIVDDRTKTGISWGNKNGALTIWLRKGKFADELPNEETGYPKYTISSLSEVKRIL